MQVKITKTCSVDGKKYKKGEIADLSHFNSHCMEIIKKEEKPRKKARTKKSKKQ